MKVAILQCFHEANVFSATAVTLDDFRTCRYLSGSQVRNAAGQGTALAGVLERFDEAGARVEIGRCAMARPGGPVDASSWLVLRLALLQSLREIVSNGRAQVLVILLHGAMAAFDVDEPEGELVCAARTLVGADCIIACSVEFHANPSPLLVEYADLIVAGRQWPQTDGHQRGRRLAELALQSQQQRLKTRYFPLPLQTPWRNGLAGDGMPFTALAAAAAMQEQEFELADVAVLAGFPYADTPWMCTSILITGIDPAAVRTVLVALAGRIWDARDALLAAEPGAPDHAEAGIAQRAPMALLPYLRNAAQLLPLTPVNHGDWMFHLKMLCLAVY
ncbi:MAG: M81 family metallopeptidase [Janthinobacterium lividum]